MRYSGIQNKVAIVTGSGEGIGFALAKLLLKAGAKVVVNDIDEDKIHAAVSQLENSNCIPFPGDAGSVDFINELVDFTIEHFGKVDFIIPNAAITIFGSFLECSPEDFQKTLQLNLHGAFFLVQRAANEMIKRKSGGKIVLLSSQVGIRAYKNLTPYAMTKAALRMMAINLACELGEHQINLNVVAPGATLTERTAVEQPDYAGMWGQLNPNGRVGTPEDIANTILFLLSDEASHINGQTIPVDGGWTTAGKYPEDL